MRVGRSRVAGTGVFADAAVAAGAALGQYPSTRLNVHALPPRLKLTLTEPTDTPHDVVAYVNHAPTAADVNVRLDSDAVLRATRALVPGEELFLNYDQTRADFLAHDALVAAAGNTDQVAWEAAVDAAVSSVDALIIKSYSLLTPDGRVWLPSWVVPEPNG